MEFNFRKIEEEVKDFWKKEDVYHVEIDHSKEKYYALDFFPYPSGAGLHVGHPLGYIACDIYARYKRLKGFNVLHPMGFDSFGLPAEQYAIQTGQHPAVTTEKNIQTFKEQLDKLGFSYDWSREIRTSDPSFYKWTQWIFIQWFHSWYNRSADRAEPIGTLVAEFEKNGNKKIDAVTDETEPFDENDWNKKFSEKKKSDILLNYRLAYLADSWVNWCPALGTVLANDEVKDGVSERGGYPVERKLMKQWSVRITAYAERLLNDLEKIQWSDAIKETQRNWIGRSEGCSVRFEVKMGSGVSSLRRRGAGGEEDMGKRDGYLTGNKSIGTILRDNARENRKISTAAENLLWQNLRNRNLGEKFRRQHPVGSYIPDFVCLEKKLIIELDGEQHKENHEYDLQRTKSLADLGYKVIRFWNDEILKDIPGVLKKIREELKLRPNFLTPNPSPEERGTADASPDQQFIEVFTTRPDTIFGTTFLTLAPEHELVEKITTSEYRKEVEEYVHYAKNRSERDRMADVKKITGQFTGAYAIHPFTEEEIPIWIGEYVLATYGTGAVMSVPGHDERDHAFAKHFGLPIISIIKGVDVSQKSYDVKEGSLCNSDFLNGLTVPEAIKKAIDEIEKRGIGKRKVNYKLRDAIFGRQRYWGEPIPIYYDEEGIPQTVDEKDLPVVLPEVDKYLPTETGEPPLARAKGWTYRPDKPLSNSPQRGEDPLAQNLQDPNLIGYETSDKINWGTLKENSREHRKHPTEAEKILWQRLRNHQLGEHFRRQHAIGNFIVDFVCLKKKLIVEVDGGVHLSQIEEDQAREEELLKFGFRILRFKNEEVISDVDGVLKNIKDALKKIVQEQTAMRASKVLPIGEDLGGASEGRYPLETTTMPGWAGSNWYYLRYGDPNNEKEFASKESIDYWQNMDLYLGGDEHATGHLLYMRFCTKFMFDRGFIPFDEPAKKLVNQGKIQGVSNLIARVKDSDTIISFDKVDAYLEEHPDWREDLQYVHVDISLCTDNKLNVQKLKSWRDDFADVQPIFNEKGEFLTKQFVEKMSKRYGNVVNPDDVVRDYGADSFRLYEMFLGPLEQHKPWDTKGIDGVSRFLKKFWKLFSPSNLPDGEAANAQTSPFNEKFLVSDEEPGKEELKILHRTIKKVSEDIEAMNFNTSVSAFMICVNELSQREGMRDSKSPPRGDLEGLHSRKILEPLLIVMSPFAPFITEFLWRKLGHEDSIVKASFPEYDGSLLVETSFEYPVAVNGKTRVKMNFDLDLSSEQIEKEVLSAGQLQKYFDGKTPKKVIVVKGRMINVVV